MQAYYLPKSKNLCVDVDLHTSMYMHEAKEIWDLLCYDLPFVWVKRQVIPLLIEIAIWCSIKSILQMYV